MRVSGSSIESHDTSVRSRNGALPIELSSGRQLCGIERDRGSTSQEGFLDDGDCAFVSLTSPVAIYCKTVLNFTTRHKSVYELAWDRDSDLVAFRESDLYFLTPHDFDDEFITENAVSSQSTNLPSLTAGFNAEKCLLKYLISSQRIEAPRSSANNTSRTHPEVLSQDLAYILDDLPPPLELWQLSHSTTESTGNSLRSLQWSIQRANIHTTHLWIRTLLLNQEAEHAHSTNTHATTEDICRQLLHLLTSSSLASLEPNGHVLVSCWSTHCPT